MFCLCLLIFLSVARGETTAEQNQTPALNPEEMYQDMFPLTWGNFTEKVLRSKDPWIVIFHDGQMDRAWKTMATHLRGLCWIGMIDTREERTLMKQIVSCFIILLLLGDSYTTVCPPVRGDNPLVDYLLVQAGKPWYNYYILPSSM